MAVDPPFATVSDLEARWRTLTADEKARAQVLIDDASDKITTTCTGWVDASEATLRRITCAMVKRAMATPMGDDVGALTSASETTGPFTQQFAFANPNGDLYLTKAERLDLGDGRQHAFEVDLLADWGAP